MLSANNAITRARRDLTIGAVLKAALVAAALAGLVLPSLLGSRVDSSVVLLVVGGVWVGLSIKSARSSRLMAESTSLIAAGRFDAAERRIDRALRAFSIFRGVKLLSLHHLATLRHAQRRWQESAELCRGLLAQGRVQPAGLKKASRLILAESLLELNDLTGVRDCIDQLYRVPLSLTESIGLLSVQLDFESRSGLWAAMMDGVMTKVGLAELMPSLKAARAQALLALAARHIGRGDWEQWLRSRAELLVDPAELIRVRPQLEPLWKA